MASIKSKINLGKAVIAIKKALSSTDLLTQSGGYVRKRIYDFTKSGKSLVTGSKLKELSPGYVKARRNLGRWHKKRSKRQKLTDPILGKFVPGDFFSPARSNLTLTGQLLDALIFTIDRQRSSFTVTVNNKQRKASPMDRKDAGTKTNYEVSISVARNGRPFIGLDEKGEEILRRNIIASLRRKLKR